MVWDWTASTGLTTRHTIDSLTVSDFEATLNAQRLRGPEATACYGLVFRENYSGYYVFLVCDDKTYEVAIYNNDSWNVLISWTTSEFIKPGEVNQLTVLGSDESFQLYINGEYIDSFQDNTFRSGHVGIIIQLNEGDSAEFSFDNLAVLSP